MGPIMSRPNRRPALNSNRTRSRTPWPSCSKPARCFARRARHWKARSCRMTTTAAGPAWPRPSTRTRNDMTVQTMTARTELRSWVESTNGHSEFSLANLPLGIFSRDGEQPRGGVAVGDCIFDLSVACEAGQFEVQAAEAAKAASASSLNAFFDLGAPARQALRQALQNLLAEIGERREQLQRMGESLLQLMDRCRMHLPARIGDYTDFYVGIHHANNVGKLFR